MTTDAWITLGLTVAMIVAMIRNVASPDVILLAGLTSVLGLGILTPQEAFAGFSNTGMLTIAVLFVVSAGIQETGGLDYIVGRLLGQPRSLAAAQLRMMLPVSAISAFLNNTPVVAMMVPMVGDWSRRIGISPSKLYIPLSYAAIVGGSCTIIGTATNLVVLGLANDRIPEMHVGMFEIAQLGLPVTLVTLLYTLVASRALLPTRDGTSRADAVSEAREYTVAMRVEASSPLVGKTIEDAGLRHLPGLFLIEIERADSEVRPAPGPKVRLHAEDRLVFAGIIDSVVDLQKIRGLSPSEDQVEKLSAGRPNRRLVEAVISSRSDMIAQTIRDAGFRTRYNAAIIAVHRQGAHILSKVGDIILQPGDTLLMAAPPSFCETFRNDANFALVSEITGSTPPDHRRGWIATSLLAAMVCVSAASIMPLITAGAITAGLMLATRCLTAEQARRSIDLTVLLTIAAAFGIGGALEKTGAAATLAVAIVELAAPFGPIGLLTAIYATTVLLAAVITTSAAAVLMFPLAYAAVTAAGLEFRPFMYCLMLGASANFLTPIGYQTNLMVYGPGRYRFADFTRFGLPLQILVGITTIAVANAIWL